MAVNFSDTEHNLAELVFRGVDELDPVEKCRDEVIEALANWKGRADHTSSGAEHFHVDNCAVFSISYQGEACDYWPDEAENDTSEIFVREFLYDDGICNIKDEHVRLLQVRYSMMAMDGDEYLLICPYLTESKNISGIVVACVSKQLRE